MDDNILTVRPITLQPSWFLRAARVLLVLTGAIYPCVSVANSLNTACVQHPTSCLSVIEQKQQNLAVATPSWWALEADRLQAFFNLQNTEQLYIALRPWIDNPDVLVEYQPYIAMMYGKWLQIKGRDSESVPVFVQALNGYRALSEQRESMQWSLDILNLLVLLDREEEAKTYALELVERSYDSPLFYREVFAELAHIANKADARHDHVKYRRESVRWAEKIPDAQQKAVAYNNYGAALQKNAQYIEAEQALLKGVEFAKQAGDPAHVNKQTLRLAEVAFALRDLSKAQSFLDKIDISLFHPGQVARFRQLSDNILAARHDKPD